MSEQKQVEFTVESIKPPQEGYKTGSVKTTEGDYYNVFPSDLGSFSPGARYSVKLGSYQNNRGETKWSVLSPGRGGEITPLGGAQSNAPSNSAPSRPTPTRIGGDRKGVEIGMWAAAKCITWTADQETNIKKLTQVYEAHEAAVDSILEAPMPEVQADLELDDEIPFK